MRTNILEAPCFEKTPRAKTKHPLKCRAVGAVGRLSPFPSLISEDGTKGSGDSPVCSTRGADQPPPNKFA